MASQFDLAPRLSALEEMGLTVTSDYNSAPPRWLLQALKDNDVRVLNVKGIPVNDSICMIRLSFLEALLATVEETLTAKELA